MPTIKNFGLSGVSTDLQFGKTGPHLKWDSVNSQFIFDAADDSTLVNVSIADPSIPNHATTKRYVDSLTYLTTTSPLHLSGNVISINANGIDNTLIRQGAGLSVIGNSTNVTANIADIVGTTDQVLRINTVGTALGFGTIATGGISSNAITYAKIQLETANTLLGNPTGSNIVPSEITLNPVLTFSGTTLTVATNGITNSFIRQSTGLSVVGNTTNSTANVGDITGTANQILAVNSAGTSLGFTTSIGGSLFFPSGGVVSGNASAVSFGTITPNNQIDGTTDNTSAVGIGRWSNNSNPPVLIFQKSRNTTIGSNTVLTSGDIIGRIDFEGINSTPAIVDAAFIQVVTDGTPGTNVPSRFEWYTGTATTTPALAMTLSSTGSLGLGVSPGLQYGLHVSKNITGSTVSFGIAEDGTIQSDVTNLAVGFYSHPGTQATAFTLTSLYHFEADPATFGAGSAVNSQIGFYAASTLSGAVANTGFYSNLILNGTNNYNFYANGTAPNYFAAYFGVGVLPIAGNAVYTSMAATSGITTSGFAAAGSIQSSTTNNANIFNSNVSTIAASFTLANLRHFYATQGTIGAGSVVTTQYGYVAESSLTGATTNYGFYSNLATSGTARWNFYANGTAPNYFGGSIGMNTTSLNGYTFRNAVNITGSVNGAGIACESVIQSDVTTSATYFSTAGATQATSFTLGTLKHFYAAQGTFGAGSAVTHQYGFYAESNLTGAASDNFGFYSNIATSGVKNWNFYANGTAPNFFTGTLGIKNTSTTTGLNVDISVTTGTTAQGMQTTGTIQSTTTAAANSFISFPATQAASFTLAALSHFYASQGTFGAGSTVTNQYGFRVDNSFTGATNNYGFHSNIAVSGTARWAFYGAGTAPSQFGGSVGLGTTSLTQYGLRDSLNITGSTTAAGIYCDSQVQSDVTTTAFYFGTAASTQATAFTLGTLRHFYAQQGTFGAGSAVTHQYGFYAENSLTGGTDNFGFYSNLAASGTARWAFYGAGTAPSQLGGSLGLGSTSLTAINFRNTLNITGNVSSFGTICDGQIQSDVTSFATYYESVASTQATAFTVGSIRHFYAQQGTIGAGSAVTHQYGFFAESNLASGTSDNKGFYGNLAVNGIINWNFYANGTAPNFFAGSLGLNSTSLTGIGIRNSLNIAGAVASIGTTTDGVIQSTVTSSAAYFKSAASTQAASFTLTDMFHYQTVQNTIGAGSTVTNQYGFAAAATLTGATNNFGFHGNIASGSNRWNAYMTGTAANYFAGQVSVGTSTLAASALLNISSTTLGFLPPVMTATQVAAVSTPATGLQVHNSTQTVPNFYDGTNWEIFGRLMPTNSKSADYTLVIADAGITMFHPAADTTARTFTIPANASVAFTVGTELDIINETAAGTLTIAITSDTLLFAGAGSTGSRTLAASGWAKIRKITATKWIITNLGGLT